MVEVKLKVEEFHVASRVAAMTPSKTMAVAALAKQLRQDGADIIDLGTGEPDFPTPYNILYAAHRAMDEGHTKYTPAAGTMPLKQAIRERFAAEQCLCFNLYQHLRINQTADLDH